MKKFIISILFVSVFFVLSGCSLLEETNDTLNYATEATEYIDELSNFAEETTGLVSEAANNPEEKAELESKLTALEGSITEFNNIDVPMIAEGLHENIEGKNLQLLDAINNVIQNGEVTVEQLQESEVFKTIENITSLMNQVEQLGF